MGLGENIKKPTLTNIILTLLVLSSIVLSFSLWTTGRNIGEEESEQLSGSPARISVISHSIEEVYRPRIIAFHGIIAENPLMIMSSYGLDDFLQEIINDPNTTNIEGTETLTKELYLERLRRGQWVEFVYPDEMPFGMISSIFSDLPTDTAELFFDRIVFDQTDNSQVYFYHMESETFYTTEGGSDFPKRGIESLLAAEETLLQPAQATFLNNTIKYLPTEPMEVPYQSYIINQFPDRIYINNFFSDTSLVDVRSADNSTRYIDLTKEVTINESNHTLTYLSQVNTAGEMTPHDRYRRSFQQINQFENWSDSLIFASYDRDTNILVFRREIKGIPVFSKNEYESIAEISLVEDGIIHMKLPMRYVNTPINIKGSPKKTLISGVQMIGELREIVNDEDFQQIKDFSIGYSWQESSEDSQVVNFEPNWFVFYKNQWLTYSELVDIYKETVYGF